MSIPCPVDTCIRDMPGTATICGACTGDLERALGDIPWLAEQLDLTLSRQSSKDGGGRSAVVPLPYAANASEAGWVLRNTLIGWVRDLSDGLVRPDGPRCNACEHPSCRFIAYTTLPDDTMASMARWLLTRMRRLIQHPAAAEVCDEITAAVRGAERVIDRPPGYIYAGPCDECGYALYAKPGAHSVQCRTPGCDADAVRVSDRRHWMREECKDLLGSPSYVAMVCTGLGATVSPSTVRVWISRNKILPRHFVRPMTENGEPRPLYRVGDVLKRIVGDGQEEAYSA